MSCGNWSTVTDKMLIDIEQLRKPKLHPYKKPAFPAQNRNWLRSLDFTERTFSPFPIVLFRKFEEKKNPCATRRVLYSFCDCNKCSNRCTCSMVYHTYTYIQFRLYIKYFLYVCARVSFVCSVSFTLCQWFPAYMCVSMHNMYECMCIRMCNESVLLLFSAFLKRNF